MPLNINYLPGISKPRLAKKNDQQYDHAHLCEPTMKPMREMSEHKFSAPSGVSQSSRRPFKIGSVLDD